MEEFLKRLQTIHRKIAQMQEEKRLLKDELRQAHKQLERLRKLVEIQNATIKEQEQQLKIKRLATGLIEDHPLTPNESRALKQKVNEMIKEIDKVITLIHE